MRPRAAAVRGINPRVSVAALVAATTNGTSYCCEPTTFRSQNPEDFTCILPPGRKGALPPLQVGAAALPGTTSGRRRPHRTAAQLPRSRGGVCQSQVNQGGTGERESADQSPEPSITSTGWSAAVQNHRSYLFEVTRQLTHRAEHGFDPFGALVDAEPQEEEDDHGPQEEQDRHPPHSRTCTGAQQEQSCSTWGATQQVIAASKTDVSPGRVWMQTGEVKVLSFRKCFSQVWTSTQYLVSAFRSGKVTRLALLLMFRTSED